MTKKEKIKKRALEDLFFFSREILGYEDVMPQPHQELCDILMDTKKKQKLVMMPRGSFKSTIATISFPIWLLCRDRNLRILIVSETYANAKKYLVEIKSHLSSNKKLISLFGAMEPKKKRGRIWNEAEIGISGRKVLKDPSISTGGVDQTKVGTHANVIIMDDVVTNNSTGTPEQIQKTIDYYKYMMSVLDPGNTILIIGTKYHHSDLYSYILENHKDMFDIHIKKAIQDDGSLLFPTRLTHDFLMKQKQIQGSYIFNCQYLNEASDEEASIIKLKNVKWFFPRDMKGRNFEYFLTLDPAVSLRKRADFSGFIVNAVDFRGDWYIVEALRMKALPDVIINKIFEFHSQYHLSTIGIEAQGLQLTLKHGIDKEMETRNNYLPITVLKPDTRVSKEMRIKGLQPLFEQGKIHLMKKHHDLIDELEKFPTAKWDDLIDALANQVHIVFPAKNLNTVEVKEKADHESRMESYKDLPRKQRIIWENLELEQSGRRRRVKDVWEI